MDYMFDAQHVPYPLTFEVILFPMPSPPNNHPTMSVPCCLQGFLLEATTTHGASFSGELRRI